EPLDGQYEVRAQPCYGFPVGIGEDVVFIEVSDETLEHDVVTADVTCPRCFGKCQYPLDFALDPLDRFLNRVDRGGERDLYGEHLNGQKFGGRQVCWLPLHLVTELPGGVPQDSVEISIPGGDGMVALQILYGLRGQPDEFSRLGCQGPTACSGRGCVAGHGRGDIGCLDGILGEEAKL